VSNSESDKSEKATPHSLKKAREKGQVSRGMDLGFFTSLGAAIVFAWLAGGWAVAIVFQGASRAISASSGLARSPTAIFDLVDQLFFSAARPVLLFGLTLFVIVLAFELVQVGPVFSVSPLKPDFGRINPAKGLKRLLSWRLLIETMKSILKLGIYGMIGWLVIRTTLYASLPVLVDGSKLSGIIGAAILKLLLFCALAALFFAMLDQVLVRRDFSKKMRMSRRDVRREHREHEGDERQKQKRKQLHVVFSKAAMSLRNVRQADIVLVNPTRYAVALAYKPDQMEAPIIVSFGRGNLAARIRSLAFSFGVLIVEDRLLARSLFKDGRLDAGIPEKHFQAVADHYVHNRLTARKTD
jgi:flagellar biosynthesis protein FlhB